MSDSSFDCFCDVCQGVLPGHRQGCPERRDGIELPEQGTRFDGERKSLMDTWESCWDETCDAAVTIVD